jgi:predicted transposase/invertase (TIGR01784 family)
MDDRRIISFDWAVKRMLRDKANFGILEGLFQVLTGRQMRIVEILESEANQLSDTDKFNRVDIKAKDENDDIIIVEVQVNREIHYLERILYGASKAITEHIALGQGYEQVKKVYSISVLYFNIGEGSDYLYHGTTNFVGVHSNDTLKMNDKERKALKVETPADFFPEYYLLRVNQFNDVATTPLEEWLDYLKNQRISPDTTTAGLQQARIRLAEMSMSDTEKAAYYRHLENLMIENEDISTARAEGREESARTIAHRLLLAGIDRAVITQATGITEEELSLMAQ